MNAVASKPARLPELNWIRGVAALIIMLFHYTATYSVYFPTTWKFQLTNGAGAVSTFFVLSGFLTVLALKDSDRAESYLWKRAKRLYPTYWVCILLTTVGVYLLLPSRASDLKTIAVNFTMLQSAFGYPHVDAVYWTMQFELRFYVFIAVLLLLRQQKNVKWFTLLWLIVSIVLYQLFIRMGITRRLVRLPAIWLMVESCPPFAIGVFLACLWRSLRDRAAWFGLCLSVAYAIYAQTPAHLAAQLLAGGVVLLALFLRTIPATAQKYTSLVAWLDRGPLKYLTWFASISYPFYLLHEFIGWGILQNIEKAGLHAQWIIIFPFAASTLLAWLVHHFVEQKVR